MSTRDTLYMATPGVSPLLNDGILFRQRLSKWVTRRFPAFTQDVQCIRTLEIAVAAATVPVRMYTAHFQLIFRYARELHIVVKSTRAKYVCACKCLNITLPDYSRQRNFSALRAASLYRVMSFYSAIFSEKLARALHVYAS